VGIGFGRVESGVDEASADVRRPLVAPVRKSTPIGGPLMDWIGETVSARVSTTSA